jgi:hypothetical protein
MAVLTGGHGGTKRRHDEQSLQTDGRIDDLMDG